MDEEKARAAARNFASSATDADRLEQYVTLLLEENSRQNLISAASVDTVWNRHILDSAQLLRFVDHAGPLTWLDIGTGPGLPGMVVAALRPSWTMLLVEPRKQRCDFLRRCVESLHLENVQIIQQRIERVSVGPVDVVSARALSNIEAIVAHAAPFATADTYWLLHRGKSVARELQELPRQLADMFHVEQSLTSEESKVLIGRVRPSQRTHRR